MEQEPTQEPGKIKPWLLITLGVVVLAAIGFFGWYFWNKNQSAPTPVDTFVPVARVTAPTPFATPSISPSTSPSVSASPISTADWKTYTNTDYSYSIKYPSTWTVDLASKDSRGKTLATFLAPGMNNAPHDKTVNIQVSLTTNVSRVDSADYIKRNGNVIISTLPVVVGGVSTDKFITNFNNGYGMVVYVEKNSETYTLELNNTASSDKEYISNFDLMLSTFQFTK